MPLREQPQLPAPKPTNKPMLERETQYLRKTTIFTVVSTLVGGAIGWLIADYRMALGILIGAAIAHANFHLSARTMSDAFDKAQRGTGDLTPGAIPEGKAADTVEERARKIRPSMLIRLPFLAAALMAAIWFLPTRPEGIAFGVILALFSAVFAALGKGQNV